MSHVGAAWWSCGRCAHKVMTHDQGGKPFKKEPVRCPSCGHKCDADCKHGRISTGPSRRDPNSRA